jgi:hypothetical protein
MHTRLVFKWLIQSSPTITYRGKCLTVHRMGHPIVWHYVQLCGNQNANQCAGSEAEGK